MSRIEVTNLGKAYKVYPSHWARLKEWMVPFSQPRHELKWVLRDINFTVEPGEAVGIVGINGAGKSTLLKMITGTTQPTTGSVKINGRVSALLELGMGFHPDFTGRQNVFMAGQLLGLSVEEISALMPEIEAFAEIGDYIDQPVRVYSSGMQVRLAFAVSTAVRPDVLIVDEALAVGDAVFQRRCFSRIEAFRSAGMTLLFVSHDIEAVKKLCDIAFFIKDACLSMNGSAKQVCDEYERYMFAGNEANENFIKDLQCPISVDSVNFDPSLDVDAGFVYGSGAASIDFCCIKSIDGKRINVIKSGDKFKWCYRVNFNEAADNPIFAMLLKTREGIAIYGVDTKRLQFRGQNFCAGDSVLVEFTLKNLLAPGYYYFNCGVRVEDNDGVEFLCRRVDSAVLKIIMSEISSAESGLLEMQASCEIGLLPATGADFS